MKNRIFLIFLTTGIVSGVGTAAFADGSSAAEVAVEQTEAAAEPVKLLTKQWKVPATFFPFLNPDFEGLKAKEVLQKAGISFPKGASVRYSAKEGVLTLVNTQKQIGMVDNFVQRYFHMQQDPTMPLGRTTEDFKKWSAAELKRRAAVYSSMKKVKDEKSARKCVHVIKKMYRYDLAPEKNLGEFVMDCPRYSGSTDDVDLAVQEEVKKKFSKQLRLIMKEQQRLLDMDESVSGSEECRYVIDYASVLLR